MDQPLLYMFYREMLTWWAVVMLSARTQWYELGVSCVLRAAVRGAGVAAGFLKNLNRWRGRLSILRLQRLLRC